MNCNTRMKFTFMLRIPKNQCMLKTQREFLEPKNGTKSGFEFSTGPQGHKSDLEIEGGPMCEAGDGERK